ncbi:ABC transporter ATP-binding protein [Sinomonas sp. P10A9]|uniref:ABC transporter ATP-binding protein n=1 Tax=Sinomonas puerhi TaxID=3238584 RepID=A0AB39L874_9MICC
MKVPNTLLAAEVTRFAYDGAPLLLRDVRLALGEGTLTAVLGGSGSGTSTLAKILAGWALTGGRNRFEGHLELAGSSTRLAFHGTPDDPRLSLGAWGRHVAFVPQRAADLLTGASATVGEEIAFTLEHRGLPRERMRACVEEAARAVGLAAHLHRHPAGLSGGEERRLALACAIVGEPAVLVLDDPAASLDADGRAALARLVDAERARGAAVVVAGSCADGLARCADHWILLDGGTAVAAGRPAEVLASAAFGRSGVLPRDPAEPGYPDRTVSSDGAKCHDGPEVSSASASHSGSSATSSAASEGLETREGSRGAPLAVLDRVTFAYPGTASDGQRSVLIDADFEVRPGEVVAITGPNGAGKSTALRHLAGLVRPGSGRVRIGGQDIAGLPAGRVAEHVGTLFQEPRDQLFERTALREVAFGLRIAARGRPRVPRDVAERRALEALRAVGLEASAGEHPYDLPVSGQRLVALATVIARSPRVLLLDEPTVGLDRHGLARLESVVAEAAQEGCGVVLSTHALGWARRHAHRVLALEGGRFVAA